MVVEIPYLVAVTTVPFLVSNTMYGDAEFVVLYWSVVSALFGISVSYSRKECRIPVPYMVIQSIYGVCLEYIIVIWHHTKDVPGAANERHNKYKKKQAINDSRSKDPELTI